MKNPLHYQVTEYDCGPTSYHNALNYLYDREDINVELLLGIKLYTMDLYQNKEIGSGGTSRISHLLLSHFLSNYSVTHNFPLSTEMYYGSKVNKALFDIILRKGIIVTRVYQKVEHYVLVTKIDDGYVYIFDPYYIESIDDEEITLITDNPKKYNRKVTIKRFFSITKEDFSLGPIEKRECNILYKKHKAD